jgi:glucarate dehydratase
MKITDVRATTVSVPLDAPLRHANGCHWGRFVRTIVEVEADNGLVGLGEMGGGGESAAAGIRAMKRYLAGRDPARLEEMRFLLSNPTASLYNNRSQMAAAIEFACFDLLGQVWGVPVSDILGGPVRDRVLFASYVFFRYAAANGTGTVRTVDQVVAHAAELKSAYGFTTHKMKGGVFPPDYELECYRALAAAFPRDRIRFDPNAVWSAEQAVRFGRAIEPLNNDYLEDPVFGLAGMRRVREKLSVPLATNTVVVNFEQLAANVLKRSVDVILLDTTFWGGIRPCVKAAGVCETFQLGVAVHSSGELGVQLATMLHLGAVVPNLSFAADAHYHHLQDDIIEGGKLKYEDGAIRVPSGPGLGVRLDRDKLAEYEEHYKRLGPYPYDQDPGRPGWTPLIPNDRWADPADDREPFFSNGGAAVTRIQSQRPKPSVKQRSAARRTQRSKRT